MASRRYILYFIMDLLIKNGTIVTADGQAQADVAVKDGKIAGISGTIRASAHTKVIDANGLMVLPGAIDAHTHFELHFGGVFSSADDFYAGTRAAACGGVTAVIDFVTPGPGEGLMAALVKRRAQADPKVCIDYALHMSLTHLNDDILDEMKAVTAAGISSFKVYMTYEFRLSHDEFIRALLRAKDLNALIMVHAEAHGELEALKAQFAAQGRTDPWHHYLSRPESVESKAVSEVIGLTRRTGAALYIVHLACEDGVKAVRAAQREGLKIYAETCPQYLHFTNDVFKRPDGHNFVCSPPMKGESSREALRQAVKDGIISTVATDHCPFCLNDKARGADDFTKIPNGVMGTEILYPYLLSFANEGHIPYNRVLGLCCENPAGIFGFSACKGSLDTGKDADIVLYDPAGEFTVSTGNMHSDADYTIWEGVRLKGRIVSTYSRGALVYDGYNFTGSKGYGKYILAK